MLYSLSGFKEGIVCIELKSLFPVSFLMHSERNNMSWQGLRVRGF